MKISRLIEQLENIKKAQGDIEVTCTGSLLPDGYSASFGDVSEVGPSDIFETTVENIVVRNDSSDLGHRVRLYL
jgi:hypothetical protein